MLDQETRRKIDSARDILVGKLSTPNEQVEQITIALIYKFMDDMDKQSEEWGGKVAFFTGEFEKYSWSKIFDPKIGGHELVVLYGEALEKMNHNPNIPQLFRNIFKNAFLPYRDPATLKAFLKQINEFTYNDSEQLGDAFEYLLSVLGKQGEAGAFRTPRHIIDFIVEIVDPKKNETVLDPACGTAGFLISSYRHILRTNKKDKNGDKLTTDEKIRLVNNFTGHDIAPGMVRLALVNMYLHGFPDPKIFEYDTLTSDEKWDETYDVILANPPFMTPKGGIRPHKRFSIQARRSEVLFVDYIAEHLNPNGRAGVIVPEGVIFQSQTAYKNLRKMLVEDYLWAVISLPAGVFNPYSGVKTSILLMDRALAKRIDRILFVKIINDGFDLGAQRRPIEKNDLPEALQVIQNCDTYGSGLTHFVEKSKIAESGDWNLSGERYKINDELGMSNYELVKIGDICKTLTGGTPLKEKKEYYENGTIPWLRSGEVRQNRITESELFISQKGLENSSAKMIPKDSVLIAMYGATAGQVGFLKFKSTINQAICAILPGENIRPEYLFWILSNQIREFKRQSVGGAQQNLSQGLIKNFQIPLPPLPMQEEIVAEIEGYQKIIDGARQVVDNYKPSFKIDSAWELTKLNDVCLKITDGSHFSPKTVGSGFPYITVKDMINDMIDFENCKYVEEEVFMQLSRNDCNPKKNDVLFSKDGTVGKVCLVDFDKDFVVLSSIAIIRPDTEVIYPRFLKYLLKDKDILNQAIGMKTGSALRRIVLVDIKKLQIPLPSISIQREIVSQIESEQEIINANKKLMEIFEQKIKDKIADVWGNPKK